MSTLHEQARAEAEKRYPYGNHPRRWMVDADRDAYEQGFLAGHEAATRTREVTTVTELDALPVGSVVRTKHLSYIKYAAKSWIGARGTRVDPLTLSAFAPLTVLYEPEEGR